MTTKKQSKPRGSSRAVPQQSPMMRRMITSAVPMRPERQSNVMIAYHQAMTALTNGFADRYHLDTILYALGVAVVLCDQRDIGDENVEKLRTAMAGMSRTKERYLATGKMGIDGPALVAARAAYQIHERQVQLHTMGELQDAISEMYRRVEERRLVDQTALSQG